jgi:hypothetical protein
MNLQYRHRNQFLGHLLMARAGEDVQVSFFSVGARAKMDFLEYVPFLLRASCHASFERALSTDHRPLSQRTSRDNNRIRRESLTAVAASTELLPVDLVSERRITILTLNPTNHQGTFNGLVTSYRRHSSQDLACATDVSYPKLGEG